MLLTRRLRTMILIALLVCSLSGMTACAPKTAIVPDDRQLIDLKDGSGPRPGWIGISGGYLRDIFRDCGITEK